jgi:hypothetical protein
MPGLTRRHILGLSARIISFGAICSVLTPKPAWAQIAHTEKADPAILAALIRELFPHDGLEESFYAGLTGAVSAGLAGKQQEYDFFVSALDDAAGGSWVRLEPEARRMVLGRFQSETFFSTLRNNANAVMYVQPEVWALLGYRGNALAQGGYLNRGFNDIDWLGDYQ